MANIIQSEAVAASSIASGVSLAVLLEPLNDIMTEFGASPKLASGVTRIVLVLVPLVAGWWARSHTISQATHDATIKVALDMPADTTKAELNRAVKEELKS